jgi:hypothetical protein
VAVRRAIPTLEPGQLTRPSELSEASYNLGNALREASDTYLSIHRQLQFISTRLLHEHHLSTNERDRLSDRVAQMIPVMQQVGAISRSVAQQLAISSYGPDLSETAESATPEVPTAARTTQSSTPPMRENVPNIGSFLSELLRLATGGSQSTNAAASSSAAATQVLEALPSFASAVSAMAGNGSEPASSEPASGRVYGSTGSIRSAPTEPVGPTAPLGTLGLKVRRTQCPAGSDVWSLRLSFFCI